MNLIPDGIIEYREPEQFSWYSPLQKAKNWVGRVAQDLLTVNTQSPVKMVANIGLAYGCMTVKNIFTSFMPHLKSYSLPKNRLPEDWYCFTACSSLASPSETSKSDAYLYCRSIEKDHTFYDLKKLEVNYPLCTVATIDRTFFKQLENDLFACHHTYTENQQSTCSKFYTYSDILSSCPSSLSQSFIEDFNNYLIPFSCMALIESQIQQNRYLNELSKWTLGAGCAATFSVLAGETASTGVVLYLTCKAIEIVALKALK